MPPCRPLPALRWCAKAGRAASTRRLTGPQSHLSSFCRTALPLPTLASDLIRRWLPFSYRSAAPAHPTQPAAAATTTTTPSTGPTRTRDSAPPPCQRSTLRTRPVWSSTPSGGLSPRTASSPSMRSTKVRAEADLLALAASEADQPALPVISRKQVPRDRVTILSGGGAGHE